MVASAVVERGGPLALKLLCQKVRHERRGGAQNSSSTRFKRKPKSSAHRDRRVSGRNTMANAESFPPKSRVQSTKAIDWQSIWGVGFDKVTKTVINGVWEWASFLSAEW